ncbi:MAG: tetratricopeptide repeat protein [Gemmatimonadetes bacterium]|nr:tetratricopeptide repeat protein [Gemmatimonadota bacterium]
MQFPNRPYLLIGLLALTSACAQPDAGDTDEQQALASAEIAEIPVTTANEAAIVDFLAGQEMADVGRNQEANELFRSAVENDPTFAFGYLNIAYTGTSADEFNSNVELAMENIASASDGERLLIEIGAAFIDNDTDEALALAKQLVGAYPNSPRAWLNLGGVLVGRQENESAREAFMKALELDSSMYAAHASLAGSYLFGDPKDFVQAKAHAEHATTLLPEEAKGYELLGDTYRAMGELETARASYSSALEKDPSLSVAALKKGHINSFLGNYDEARADYELGVAGATAENKGFYAVYGAFVAVHAGAPGEAIAELVGIADAAEALGIRDDQVISVQMFALTNAAQIAIYHELFEAAKEILAAREAIQQANIELVEDPTFTRLQQANKLFWQARLALKMGDFETAGARAGEQEALLEPDGNPLRFQGYHQLLGMIALEQGNDEEAIAHLSEANLNDVFVTYLMAVAQEGAGNTEEATKLFTQVADNNFNSVGYALVRRDAVKKAGMSP